MIFLLLELYIKSQLHEVEIFDTALSGTGSWRLPSENEVLGVPPTVRLT